MASYGGSIAIGLRLVAVALLAPACQPSTDEITESAAPVRVVARGIFDGGRIGPTGCVWIHTADGQNVAITWPDGWTYQDQPPILFNDQRQVVALRGDIVTVDGTWSTPAADGCGFGRRLESRLVQIESG